MFDIIRQYFTRPAERPVHPERSRYINFIIDCRQQEHFEHWLTKQHGEEQLSREELHGIHSRFYWQVARELLSVYDALPTGDLRWLAESYAREMTREPQQVPHERGRESLQDLLAAPRSLSAPDHVADHDIGHEM